MKKVNQQAYKQALKWIVGILKRKKIIFNILGGLAAYAYGSKRMMVDIDINMRNKDFQKILTDVRNYIVEPPHFSKSENWQCYFMELKYKGITIEFASDKGCKILNLKTKKWQKLGDCLSKPVYKKVFGLNLPLISKKRLIAYKKKLMRNVDITDLKNLIALR